VKVFVYYIGKPKDQHANALADDFLRRIAKYTKSEMREVRPDRKTDDPWQKHPTAKKLALDPSGRELDSAGFAALIEQAEMQGRDLVFLIGAHDGLPAEWRARADQRISLSKLTYPHELARVVLLEQIYRAFATLRGHPYPR
jgi:23S rRNA (pseudouridine1915-N3)-methyltransferase